MSDKSKDGRGPKPGTDDDRDKTLTEKKEQAGGVNRNTPSPIYDV